MNHPSPACRKSDLPLPGDTRPTTSQRHYFPSSVSHGPPDHSLPILPLSEETPQPTLADSRLEEQLARILTRVPTLLRLPAQGSWCPHTQLCRTALLDLVAPSKRNGFCPPVRAIYQRTRKYAQRGVWLIPAENLFRYLLGLMESPGEEYRAPRDGSWDMGTATPSAGRN